MGQAFVDSLTSQRWERAVDVYAVNYPANDDYHSSSIAGAADAVRISKASSPAARTPRSCLVGIPRARR